MDRTKQLVVVVEDDGGMRHALRRWLLASGYRAQTFASAEELLAADGARAADCLVLDVRLSGASGTELYARLGADRPPAVFITALDGPKVRGDVARLGGGAVLSKPFLGHELMDAIDAATRRSRVSFDLSRP
jgi:FixJ family two-component response regulator